MEKASAANGIGGNMADLSQVIRWNANFVRGLAQSVLERAKTIRGSLSPAASVKKSAAKKASAKKTAVKTARRPKRNA